MTDSIAAIVADTAVVAAAVIAAICGYNQRDQHLFPSEKSHMGTHGPGLVRAWRAPSRISSRSAVSE